MTSPQTQPTPEPQPSVAHDPTAPATTTAQTAPATTTAQTAPGATTAQTAPGAPTAPGVTAAPKAPEAATAEPPSGATAERPGDEAPGQEQHPGGKVVHLHTAHPRVPIPYVTPGDMFTGARSAAAQLPSARKLAFYGALGGMAALEILEWPVALAIGAATEVITREQSRRQRTEQERHGQQPATGTSARTEPATPAPAATA